MFDGFSPEAIDFLWGIRMNNNREWFQEHKEQYTTKLYQPMKALSEDVYKLFSDRPGDYVKVSRIYKDARMHPTEPYKESLWLSVRHDDAYWAESPCLFFEIRPEGISYGFSLWKPRPGDMSTFRRRIDASSGEFLDMIQKTEKNTGTAVTAVRYKRSKELATIPELQTYFDWKEDIACIISEEVGDSLFSPELSERVCRTLRDLLPLYDYFNKIYSAGTDLQ